MARTTEAAASRCTRLCPDRNSRPVTTPSPRSRAGATDRVALPDRQASVRGRRREQGALPLRLLHRRGARGALHGKVWRPRRECPLFTRTAARSARCSTRAGDGVLGVWPPRRGGAAEHVLPEAAPLGEVVRAHGAIVREGRAASARGAAPQRERRGGRARRRGLRRDGRRDGRDDARGDGAALTPRARRRSLAARYDLDVAARLDAAHDVDDRLGDGRISPCATAPGRGHRSHAQRGCSAHRSRRRPPRRPNPRRPTRCGRTREAR